MEITEQKSTKLCDRASKPDLQMHVETLRGSPKNWETKTAYFGTVSNSTKLAMPDAGK